jgi:starch-binding outer membrane protein, SusD/RagB family
MKLITNKIVLFAGLTLSVVAGVVACKKSFLDKPPLGTLNPEIMASEAGVQGLLIGAYSLVDGNGASGGGNYGSAASNWGYGGVASDDAYKGSDPSDVADFVPFEQFVSLTPTNGAVPQKWAVVYAGAQRANDVLRIMAITEGIDEAKQAQIAAQARFLRAFFHFEAKKVFGNIIYADENVNSDNTDVSNANQDEVWQKMEDDLTFAIANLPEQWGSEEGRANKGAAIALLAKVHMQEEEYAEAQTLLAQLIPGAPGYNAAVAVTARGEAYGLMPNYYSNFNPAQKNSMESVFAAQTSVQDGSSVDWGGDPNGNYGDILNFPYNGGPGACCGFYNPSQDLANAHKTDAKGLPLLDESYATKPWVSDPAGGAYTGTLDPRIDFTAGRPGIPYLDWGLHPGLAWIRNPQNDGILSPKKNVYAASQKDQFTDVGSAYWGPTELVANNVNIIRYSDVLLSYAECLVHTGTDGGATEAMKYVNMVRDRVKSHPETWVKKGGSYNAATAMYTGGTNADTYNIGLYDAATFGTGEQAMKAIRFERRIELAMEGHRFFDLQRYNFDPTYKQSMADVINRYIAREKGQRPIKLNASFTPNKNEFFPIPQGTIDNMNSDGTQRLAQNPGY